MSGEIHEVPPPHTSRDMKQSNLPVSKKCILHYLPRPLMRLARGVCTGARPRCRARGGSLAPILEATVWSSSSAPLLFASTTSVQQALYAACKCNYHWDFFRAIKNRLQTNFESQLPRHPNQVKNWNEVAGPDINNIQSSWPTNWRGNPQS